MNIGQITSFLKTKGMINEKLFKKVDRLRMLRNEQHIGVHNVIKTYSKKQLEGAFSIASDVKEFDSNFLENN